MYKTCIKCNQDYLSDNDFSSKCDTCSLYAPSLTEPELTSLELRLEKQRIDEWDRTRIKHEWDAAAKASRLAILAKHHKTNV